MSNEGLENMSAYEFLLHRNSDFELLCQHLEFRQLFRLRDSLTMILDIGTFERGPGSFDKSMYDYLEIVREEIASRIDR